MVEFINIYTGTPMWVAEERAKEYEAAGHKPAVKPEEVPKEPIKKAVKKSTRKR